MTSLARALMSSSKRGVAARGQGSVRQPKIATTYTTGYHQIGGSMIPEWDAELAVKQAYYANVFVYACVKLYADTIASIPLRVGKNPEEPQDFNPEAPLAQLLGPPPGSPNPDTTPSQLWAHSVAAEMVTGRFGWELEWSGKPGRSDLVAIWPLISQYLEAIPPPAGTQSNKFFTQFAYNANGQRKLFSSEEIYYYWNPSQHSWHQPESALQAARINVSAAIMQDVYDWAFLKNDARPAAIVITERWANDDMRKAFRQQFNAKYGGPGNAGKALFSEVPDTYEGSAKVSEMIDIKQLGLSQKDSMAVDRYSSNIKSICIGLGVPLSKLDASGRTFSNEEGEDRTWWKTKVIPKLTNLAEAINVRLAPLVGDEVCWFDLSGIEVLKEAKKYTTLDAINGWKEGILRLDEARDKGFDAEPLPNGEGEIFIGDKTEPEEQKALDATAQLALTQGEDKEIVDAEVVEDDKQDTKKSTKDKVQPERSAKAQDLFPQSLSAAQGLQPEGVARTAPAPLPVVNLRQANSAHSNGVMVAFMLTPEQRNALAVPGYQPPETLHCTLAYLGKVTDDIERETAARVVEEFAAAHEPIVGTIGGKGIFVTPDGLAVVALVDAPGLSAFRLELVNALESADITISHLHDFTPHITLGYADTNTEANAIEVPAGISIGWQELAFVWGNEPVAFPLGVELERQREAEIRRKKWRAIDAQVSALEPAWERTFRALFMRQAEAVRARLDSKRGRRVQKRIELNDQIEIGVGTLFDKNFWILETAQLAISLYETVVAVAGGRLVSDFDIEFSIQAPVVQDLIGRRANKLAGQVTDTTYDQIKDELIEGVDAGETIEQLAERIQNVFVEASRNRALVIARTETMSAFNEGTYVAAREYGEGVIGGHEWLATDDTRTRHTHRKADGQLRSLFEPFDIGGWNMFFPGDGTQAPPEEIIQCRCGHGLISAEEWADRKRSIQQWRNVKEVEDELIRLALEGALS